MREDAKLCTIEYSVMPGSTRDVFAEATGYLRIESWAKEGVDVTIGDVIATIDEGVPA